jgi:hypothetical protein
MHYLPIPEPIAIEARTMMRDRFGHELHITKEKAPCRLCLRIPSVPQELILLSYQPLADRGPYAEVGPIFIHAAGCRPYPDVETFPVDFAARRLILRAYGSAGQIVDAVVARPGNAPERAAEFLSENRIAEVHVRHESYTCFDFKIVRAS